ncbi:adenosine receptor A3-like [Oculina patagonica]
MNHTLAAKTGLENTTGSTMIVLSKAEGIAWCSAFVLTSIFIVVGNLLTIVLFALYKKLRKKSLFLVINMAFADLMLGSLSLPIYIYDVGSYFQLWTGEMSRSLRIFYTVVDTIFFDASLISAAFISGERLFAIYWPLIHRALSIRTYRFVIFTVWTLALLVASVVTVLQYLASVKIAMYASIPFATILTFTICGCNIGIWKKFQHGSVASHHQNRASQSKRLTKTLLFVSVLALLSWLPLIILNCLIYVYHVQIPWLFYDLANVLNYSNSFVNPVVYALRIPEFREALASCCFRMQAAIKTACKILERRDK